MKVLIGVDGSSGGFAAVRQVGQLLSAERDQVGFYYSPPEVRVALPGDSGPEILQRARQALADAVFAEARQQLPEPLAAGAELLIGSKPPKQGLLLEAEQWKADLVVTGARGLGSLAQLLLGSVSRSVVHHAHVPVLVVRPNPEHRARQPFRVLLAWDGSEATRQAAALLERFTWPAGAEGRVITVVESLVVGEVPEWLQERARSADAEAMAQAWVREHDAEKQRTREELRAWCGQLPAPFRGREPLVVEGSPAEQILQAIAREGIDLVVLGTHGKGAIERLLIGSTSDKLLQHAGCSVLLVREHPRP